MSDPASSQEAQRHGFLRVHVEVRLGRSGVLIQPLPLGADRQSWPVDVSRFSPLVVADGDRDRYFSWRGQGPVLLIPDGEPLQLIEFFELLCAALRRFTEME